MGVQFINYFAQFIMLDALVWTKHIQLHFCFGNQARGHHFYLLEKIAADIDLSQLVS